MDILFLMDILIGSAPVTGIGPTVYSAARFAGTNSVCIMFDVYLVNGSV